MDIKTLESFRLSDAISFHDELNPKLFSGDQLRPEVRKQLMIIAQDFLTELGINDLDVKDITISGSNAAYSYTPHSDLDLHILVDVSGLSDDEIYLELFNAKKTTYNDSHDITIHGIPIELYVQDASEPVVSLGEYSVLHDKWLRIPTKRRANFDQTATKVKYNKLLDLIHLGLKTKSLDKINNLLKTIKRYRQAGLDKGGEFGPENLAYKILRKQGYITKLYDLRNKLHSAKLSIEEESKVLDKPTLSIRQLAMKHNVSITDIMDQLLKGINVELEHTNNEDVAREIALDHLNEDPHYYNKLEKVGLEEVFDQPYATKWEKSDYGDVDALAKLPDGTPLSIMFNKQQDADGDEIVQVEFYRNNSQEVTGEGDAMRVFATVLAAIQKYIKKYKPARLTFSASKDNWAKQQQNSESRAKLYDRLVKRYASGWGYEMYQEDHGDQVTYELTKIKQPVSEASGYIPSEKEKNDPRFKTALTVDVHPNTMKKDAKKFGNKISRAGIPPTLHPSGKF